jgi:UDPglucose--hexose-1-phosphate uridylyltransferase
MPEFRKDPATGRWVIIASERANRPQPGGLGHSSARVETCPFCAGNESHTPPEIMAYRRDNSAPDRPGWSVRVVPNKYPAVTATGSAAAFTDGIFEARAGIGVHEVIVEAPDHVVAMALLEERQIAAVLRAYGERMLFLQKDKRWQSILVYKNEGREAGATLEHVHSQLIALPEVPREILDEMSGARLFYDSSGRCLFCTILARETKDQTRLVAETERFVVLCPYAARFPFETWILPKTHRAYFEQCSDDDYAELSGSLLETLARFGRRFGNLAFNYVLHSAPLTGEPLTYYHWHLEIMPKLSQAAGFEWGSGSFINPVAPEEAARTLRNASS